MTDVSRGCGECRFSEPSGTGALECHRYAPSVSVDSPGPVNRNPVWPIVFFNDWCGEFEAKRPND
jgi:hypothetical protein